MKRYILSVPEIKKMITEIIRQIGISRKNRTSSWAIKYTERELKRLSISARHHSRKGIYSELYTASRLYEMWLEEKKLH